MTDNSSEIIRGQFGAALDMLERAIEACPEDLWTAEAHSRFHEFWYMAYHTLFWTDLHLFGSMDGFKPPEPFGLEELDPAGAFPDRKYSKAELKAYLNHCRERAESTFPHMFDANAANPYPTRWGDLSLPELQIYSLRHIQHHTAQLNLLLRMHTDSAPGWVGRSLKR